MSAVDDCPNCGDPLRSGEDQAVMDRTSTGFGLANEVVTWFCSRWCREASNGVPAAYRCIDQTRLDQFGEGDDDQDGPGTPGRSRASPATTGDDATA